MAEMAVHNAQSSRMRLLVWPREHGAWGILAIPLITGAAVGLMRTAHVLPLLLFTVAALALFCLRTPVESLLGTTPMRAQTAAERRAVTNVILVVSIIAMASVAALLWDGRNAALYLIGGIAAVMFIAQTAVRRLGRNARMAAQVIGALGLTSTAAGAYYVTTGRFDERAIALWLANWVFAGNQVHFVQLRIHGSKLRTSGQKVSFGWAFFVGQIGMLVALALAWRLGYLPGVALVAFVPVLVRGFAWFLSGPEPLRVHRLGFVELAHAIAFGVLLIAAFQFAS